MDDIQILKEMEQEQYEDADQMKEDLNSDGVISAEITPRRIKSGLLFIALGLIGLAAMQTSEPWSYWWLIFFAKPFLFGFGMHNSKCGIWGWGFCQPHSHTGENA